MPAPLTACPGGRPPPAVPARPATRGRRLLLALALLALAPACIVDSAIPADTPLTCTGPGQCPGGTLCSAAGRCERPAPDGTPDAGADAPRPDAAAADADGIELPDGPGAGDTAPRDVHRAADKQAICGALYDKTHACEAEVKATLGNDFYALFAADRDVFLETTCLTELLADASDAELDGYLQQLELIGVAPCALFAAQLCPMAAEGFPDAPGCP